MVLRSCSCATTRERYVFFRGVRVKGRIETDHNGALEVVKDVVEWLRGAF